MKHVGGAMLVLTFACLRVMQGQKMQFYHIDSKLGCLFRQVDVEKGRTKEPKAFFMMVNGIVSGTNWWLNYLSTTKGSEHLGLLFRGFSGQYMSQDLVFLNAPMEYSEIVKMMRIALSFATKCPLKEVSAYTMHSCRAFLPRVFQEYT